MDFAMLFDEQYSGEGLVGLASILAHSTGSNVYVLCLTDDVEAAVTAAGGIPISMPDFEAANPTIAATRSSRPWAPYVRSLKPFLIEYLFDNHAVETVTYVDSDMYFWGDAAEIAGEFGDYSFMVTTREMKTNIIFNSGCFTCRADANCREFLTWWQGKCIEWCLWEYGPDGAFAEEGYLNVIRNEPTRFTNTHVCQHPGINTAPWNLGRYTLLASGPGFTVNGRTLVCYHYRGYTKWAEEFDSASSEPGVSVGAMELLYAPYHALIPVIPPEREGS
jgi:hypothetical protein